MFCKNGEQIAFNRVAAIISTYLQQKIEWEIEKAYLKHSLDTRLKELDLLYEVSKVFNTIFDVREAAELILEKVMDALQIDKGSIMLLNEQNELTIFASKGVPKEIAQKTQVKLGEGISGIVAKTGKPMMSNKIEEENYYDEKTFKQYQTGAFMSLPLSLPLVDGTRKIIGVMNLTDKLTGEDFDRDDLKLATAIVSQAALSIENAMNYQNILSEKKKMETTIQGMSDGIIVTDPEHKITLANENAIYILQSSQQDIIGQNVFTLLNNYTFSKEVDEIIKCDKINIKYEITISSPNYTVYDVKETKIIDDFGNTINIIMVLRNITEQKRQDALKSEFLSLISHKFRTPLVGLVGYPQFLLDGSMGELNEMQTQAIKAIEQQSKQLNTLVEQLLKFAELEDKSLIFYQETHNIREIVARSIDYTSQSAKDKNIRIKIDIEENIPYVHINPERVSEVFVNLIDNAIKFSEAGTEVIIKATTKNEDFVQVDIIDQGIGIEKKEINKIFERFYQVEQYFTGQVKGAGLGLAMVKYVIKRHGGEIWVDSKVGVGSTFHFTLPIAKETDNY